MSNSKVLILESAETLDSISPHVENAKQLEKHLGYDLCLHKEPLIRKFLREGEYKSIIFTYGTGREYVKTIVPEIMDMVERTGVRPKLFYMKNEYNIGENHAMWALCRDEGFTYEMITNNMIEAESRCKKYWTDWHIVNIQNLVSHNVNIDWLHQQPEPSLFPYENNYGLKEISSPMYYGSWRKEREGYFNYWLDERFFISTSKKNYPKFTNASEANLFLPLKTKSELIRFKYTLYMEDMVSTKYFTHLANRFYECLDYDVLMFFDDICRKTVERDVYPIDDWFFVKSKEELHDKIKWCEDGVNNFLMALELQSINKPKVVVEKQKTLDQIKQIVEW